MVAALRCAAWIWYRGDRFAGFQSQPGGGTVQQTVGAALATLGFDYNVMPAGRTDAGVHARMQVVSFRVPRSLPLADVERALRAAAPEALGLVALKTPHPSFHAQWSARGKEYRYRVALTRQPPPPEWAPFAWHLAADERLGGAPVEAGRFAQALRRAEGTRDFSAFHAKSSVQKPRTLTSATVHEVADGVIEARLAGEGFARYQVRYLIGAAALVASGRLSEANYVEALEGAATFQGVRAPPSALVLWDVLYPAELDPFTAEERRAAPGLPLAPPFAPSGRDATG